MSLKQIDIYEMSKLVRAEYPELTSIDLFQCIMGINNDRLKGKFVFPTNKFGFTADYEMEEILKICEKVIETLRDEENKLETGKTSKKSDN